MFAYMHTYPTEPKKQIKVVSNCNWSLAFWCFSIQLGSGACASSCRGEIFLPLRNCQTGGAPLRLFAVISLFWLFIIHRWCHVVQPFILDDSNSSVRTLTCACTKADVTGSLSQMWRGHAHQVHPIFIHWTSYIDLHIYEYFHSAAYHKVALECLGFEL